MKLEEYDEFDELIRNTARRDYNEPPPTPTEAIWAGIERERASHLPPDRPHWWGVGIAAMLIIGIGLGRIVMVDDGGAGEMTSSTPPSVVEGHHPAGLGDEDGGGGTEVLARVDDSQGEEVEDEGVDVALEIPRSTEPLPEEVPAEPTERRAHQPIQLAALEHLGEAELMLTGFRIDIRSGQLDMGVGHWARELLTTTRLILDSPTPTTPHLEGLLLDLELVLTQIAWFPRNPTLGELQLIEDAILENDVITRLRLAVPSGSILARS